MHILLSGSRGFIGSRLVPFLQGRGHTVVCLVRSKGVSPSAAVFWDPIKGELCKEDFEGFDAVIHLAGDSLFSGRWTDKKKEKLFLSRCRDTWLLSQILLRLNSPPKVFLCASAVGYYGDRGEELLSESSRVGMGFLANLCKRWEEATSGIEERGTRVVHTRFGVVLDPRGGVLKKLIPLARLGLGVILGTGEQKMPWVSMEDLLEILHFSLLNEEFSGPLNVVAPQIISQKKFIETLAASLEKKVHLRIPSALLRFCVGECAEVFLSSAAVLPEKLLKADYSFQYPDVENYCNFCVARK